MKLRKFGNNPSCRHSSRKEHERKNRLHVVLEKLVGLLAMEASIYGKVLQNQVRAMGVVIPISKILEQACVILKIRLCHQQGQRETHVLLIFVIM